MKKKYYGIAFLAFIALLVLMYGGSLLVSLGAFIGGVILAGERGMELIYNLLIDNPNFFSILVYAIPMALILPWYYLAFVEKRGVAQTLRAHTRRLTPVCFLWVVLLTLAAQHATSLIMAAIDFLAPSVMNGMSNYSVLWVISTLILPPLLEEVVFRGLILQYLGKAGTRFFVANLIQAVFFGVYHMNLTRESMRFSSGCCWDIWHTDMIVSLCPWLCTFSITCLALYW